MTLLSTISNESINENLKKRFENKEIYVRSSFTSGMLALRATRLAERKDAGCSSLRDGVTHATPPLSRAWPSSGQRAGRSPSALRFVQGR